MRTDIMSLTGGFRLLKRISERYATAVNEKKKTASEKLDTLEGNKGK
jgi:hypothetical protein